MAHSSEHQSDGYIGRPMKRREDPRLLTGTGRYVDDLAPPGCLHAVFVRSPHAHARIARLDVDAARRAQGVVTIVTGEDVAHLGPMPVNRAIPDMKVPPHPLVALGHVRAAGVPVVAVVAESVEAARTPPSLSTSSTSRSPATVEPEEALAASAPLLFPDIEGNRSFRRVLRQGDAAAAFAAAAHRVSLRVAQSRIAAVPIEPRAVLAAFDTLTEELTLWVSCQAPFRIRAEVARLLGVPESRVRVIAPDVGGGFGVKSGPYREEIVLAWLAPRLKRPIKWIATRGEDMVTTTHARGAVCEGELALDADGRILALRARVLAPLGSCVDERRRGVAVEPRPPLARGVRGARLRDRGERRPHHDHAPCRLPRSRPAGGLLLHRTPDGHGVAGASAWTRRRFGAVTSSRPMPSRIAR